MGADELERRLAELTRQEAALRRIVADVEAGRPVEGAAPAELAAAQARAAEAEARVRELEAQVEELQRIPEPVVEEPEPEPDPEPEPEPEPESAIERIEHAIAEAHAQGAPEAEEWSFYLPLLREHARPDGSLPPEFEELVESVFGDL